MDILSQAPLTFNPITGGFVAGTTSTITSTTSICPSIGGKFGTALAALTNSASPTTDANTGAAFTPLTANQAVCLVFGVNAAGVLKLAQGPAVATEVGVTTTAGAFINAPQFPAIPDDFAPVCYCVVRTSPTGNSFTAGTTAWAASGITTTTFKNIAVLPGRPQIA